MKLKPVQSGAKIALLATASFAMEERVERGVAALRMLGYEPELETNARARGPLYFAGSAEERLADLHAAFVGDAEMAMCLRGGYGSNYLLEGLDLELIAAHPKPLFAYSDLTALQLYLLDKLGLPAFYGPMAAADFYLEDGVDLPSFHAAIAGQPYSVGVDEGLRTLRAGKAHGVLYGGCLSILCAMLGTPWEPATEGKLLFLEDVAERPYRIDRMLWQLRNAGKFAGVTGIVFGEMLNCAERDQPELLELAILNALEGMDVPIAFGLRSGHVSRANVTLTLGVETELKLESDARLTLCERAVQA
jgi:muramoyltetrapeptide carboxypeptidase